MKKKEYTVIGFYRDNMQRFSDTISAVSGAEEIAQKKFDGLSVVGVVLGSHKSCDTKTKVDG